MMKFFYYNLIFYVAWNIQRIWFWGPKNDASVLLLKDMMVGFAWLRILQRCTTRGPRAGSLPTNVLYPALVAG